MEVEKKETGDEYEEKKTHKKCEKHAYRNADLYLHLPFVGVNRGFSSTYMACAVQLERRSSGETRISAP